MGLEKHRLLNNSYIDLWCVFTFSTILVTFWWINFSWEKFTHQSLQLIFYSQPLNFNYFWRLKIDLTMTIGKCLKNMCYVIQLVSSCISDQVKANVSSLHQTMILFLPYFIKFKATIINLHMNIDNFERQNCAVLIHPKTLIIEANKSCLFFLFTFDH